MRINVEWLADWVDVGADPQALADALTSAGLEVEDVERVGPVAEEIVVAAVLAVEPHPKADRLRLADVDDGMTRRQIVCGAPNVAAGLRVPFARVGATLPDGKTIGAAEIRGIRSEGMLCSARELGLADDHSGLLELPLDAPVGTPLSQYLKLDDAILEINVTANRGDCLSVLGLAREIAAKNGEPLRSPLRTPVAATLGATFPIELQAGALCPRFVGRVVTLPADHPRQSPLWMRERLRRAGLRAIHPVVDVTNFVMLELGQPLHAYDLAKLRERLAVRLAAPGESLVLLDGRKVDLSPDVLVIADASGPIGLAGIMGGESTSVTADATQFLFESAYFTPGSIAGRPRRYGLHTDASQRFERGVDPNEQARAVERATQLLIEICGGECGPLIVSERSTDAAIRAPIALHRMRLDEVLGLTVPDARVEGVLRGLEMQVERTAQGWTVVPPAFRFDVAIEEDLIEEVGRMIGYDSIPAAPGLAEAALGTDTELHVHDDRLVDLLVARGYTEVITYSFIDEALELAVNPDTEPVRLANPISADMAVMRRSLWPGLLGVARHNLAHQRQRVKLFELGTQFTLHARDDVHESAVLAGLALGPRSNEHWGGASPDVDFFDVKGDVEALLALTASADIFTFEPGTHPALAPGRTAEIKRAGDHAGWLGVIHPDLQRRFDLKRPAILFALRLDSAFIAEIPWFRSYSKYPSIRRDLAVVVDESVSADALTAVVRAAAGNLLHDLFLFDIYRGPGVDTRRKSMGLGLILQDVSRTLTDADADQTIQSIRSSLERELGAAIRM